MKVSLNVKDRLVLVSILPNTGKMADLVEVLELIKVLKFTDGEKEEISYSESEGKITWNILKELPKDIDINFEQLRIIKSTIKELDDAGKIDLNILNTCLKLNSL